MNNIYVQNGYSDREHYLRELAEQFELDYDSVKLMADFLGPNEDFDGLVSTLEDMPELEDY